VKTKIKAKVTFTPRLSTLICNWSLQHVLCSLRQKWRSKDTHWTFAETPFTHSFILGHVQLQSKTFLEQNGNLSCLASWRQRWLVCDWEMNSKFTNGESITLTTASWLQLSLTMHKLLPLTGKPSMISYFAMTSLSVRPLPPTQIHSSAVAMSAFTALCQHNRPMYCLNKVV